MSIEAEKEARACNTLIRLYAPQDALLRMGFMDAEGNEHEFPSADFEVITSHPRVDAVTLALYYACDNGNVSFDGDDPKFDIIRDIRVDPIVIAGLITLAKIEEAAEVMSLTDEVLRERMSAAGRRAVKARHKNPTGETQQRKDRAEKLVEIWKSGKYSSKDDCAEQEWAGLEFKSFGSARRALRNK